MNSGNCEHDFRCWGHGAIIDSLDYDNEYACENCGDRLTIRSPFYAVFGSSPEDLEVTGVR